MQTLKEQPSAWVCRYAPMIKAGGDVLDLACGAGRHSLWLACHGWRVEAVDCNQEAIASLQGQAGINAWHGDLETGAWSFAGRFFDGIVVTRYLHRPLLSLLPDCLREGGVLIYETFMVGNERYGSPRSEAFLLRPNELADMYASLNIVAFEQVEETEPRPAAMQRICVIKGE